MTNNLRVVLIVLVLGPCCWATARAEEYGGIEFPQGEISFADTVIRYDPLFSEGNAPTDPDYLDPDEALGVPDYDGDGDSLSLGSGGLVELRFVDNALTNSADDTPDLHIFEIGPDVEDTFVAIRPRNEATRVAIASLCVDEMAPQGDDFCEIGKVFGRTSSIDIDALFPDHQSGDLIFDAVQLIDDPEEGQRSGATVGADIDSVGAIASAPPCRQPCTGDCDQNCEVRINELVTGVSIAQGGLPLAECAVFDTTGNLQVAVNELILGVTRLLRGCP